MKVEAHPTSDGCGLIRLRYPIDVLAAQGADVVAVRSPLNMLRYRTPGIRFDRAVQVVTEADVIILQRPQDIELLEAIPIMQRQGIAVVVEIDDDFHALPKGHPARRLTASAHDPVHNRRNLAKMCEIADMVTVATPALAARYGGHGRCRVIRNLIPASYLTVTQKRRGDVLGWTGSTVTHVDDLRVCGDGVARTLDETCARFRVIGTGVGIGEQLQLGDRPYDSTSWVPLREYPIHYARLDVAIAPLQLSPFNEAKSALKMIEAAALGVPIVGSPTSEYVRAARQGLGMTASTPDEWRCHLVRLLDSAEFRADCAGTARAAASELTYEAHAGQWWDAWTEALHIRRQNRTAA